MNKKAIVEEVMKSLDATKTYTEEELSGLIQKAVTSAAAVAENKAPDDATLNGENAPSIQDASTPSKAAAVATGAEVIPEPVQVEGNPQGGAVEAIFSPGLFGRDFTLGTTLQQGPVGNVVTNVKPSKMDYNKQYENSTRNETFVRDENGQLVKKG